MVSAKEEFFSLETDELSLQEAEGGFRAWVLGLSLDSFPWAGHI